MSATWREVTDADILRLLEECRRQFKIRRRVRLWLSDQAIGPATLGLFRPQIVLPESLIHSLDPGELRMVFLHEMSHVRRLDVLWDQFATVLAAVHWFNPAALWALFKLRDARELACDAAVLSHLGPDHARPYGELVVNLASRNVTPCPQAALVSAAGSPRLLHRRINMIATYRNSTWKHSLLGAFILLAFAVGGLTSAQPPKPSEPGSAANKPRQETKAKAGNNQQEKGESAKAYAINGTCMDEEKHPLEGVRVRLFRVDSLNLTRELVKEAKTDAAGKFEFDKLPAPVPYTARDTSADDVYYQTYYLLAATKPGRTSRLNAYMSSREPTRNVSIQMPAAGTLSGRVTDDKGRPVKGAKVYLVGYPAGQPVEGVFSDTTDADGKYSLTDLAVWDAAKEKPRKLNESEFLVVTSQPQGG